ncbi:hypothetical protein R3W88_030576 [Solanum pinnatisectum]|uniref:Uncharacterized protein n=1 Tax=Solanum pinnatisectum TaxID=50273 RepID=A0AAV9LM55_9SOLN|nr:hypothetical protein R3W88_030576 [Solanum pinnatisectum]
MGELKMQEMSLPALFEQARNIHTIASESSVDREFISFCETTELVPEEEMETSKQGGANTFADRRAKKERRGRSTKASSLSTPVESGEDDGLDVDGDKEREISKHPCLCHAFDLLEMLNKEEEILSAIKEKQLQDGEKEFSQLVLDERTKKVETWHRDAAARAPYTKTAAPITCATFAQDVIEGRDNVSQAHEHKHKPLIFGPASLVGRNPTTEREKIAAQVFQPHYRLATMSIE